MDTRLSFTLDQLRIFLIVWKEGSFSAAARRLHRTQSSVSYAVAALEQQLGVTLFDRREWKPSLTPQGKALIDQARRLLEEASGLQAAALRLGSGVEPQISLVVDVMFPIERLIEGLTAFRTEFPTTGICLKVEALGAVAEPVLDRTAHLGIMGSFPKPLPGLERVLVGDVQLVPVVAPSHPLLALNTPVSEDQAAAYEQLVLSDRSVLSAGQDFGVLADRVWRIADLHTKHSLLRAGLGWGFMPEPMISDDLVNGTLALLPLEKTLPGGGRLRLYAVYRSGELPGPAATWLLEHLKGQSRH
jgi:DNA-binding transcriptional LysR family regulator